MPRPRNQKSWELLLLALILVFALGTRLGRSHQGLPYLHFVDEPHTTVVALNVMKTGDLNPHRFHYGSLNIYMMVAVDVVHYLKLCRNPDERTGKPMVFEEVLPTTTANWRWETSHPSFYLWNRGWCAILGTLTVLLVYLLGRRVNGLVGIVSSATLAVLPVHIENSAMVAPDVPVAFFCLLAVLLSTAYMRSGRTLTLVWAFVVTGMAWATKYNVAPLILVPYLALACTRERHAARPHWLWWGGLLVSLGAFFACMPYALLDLPLFLTHVGRQVSHYAVVGHGPNTIESGWPHVWWAFTQFASSLSWPGFVLAVIGILVSLKNRNRVVLFTFPAIYFLMQTQMIVAFHRNLLAIYPFLALGLGYTLHRAVEWSEQRRPVWRKVWIAASAAVLLWAAAPEWIHARRVATSVETRSQAAREVARLAKEHGWKKVGIAELLRVHPNDLALIDAEIVIADLPALRGMARDLDAIVCPTSYELQDTDAPNLEARVQRREKRIPSAEPLWSIEGPPCQLGRISTDPGVQIFGKPFTDSVGD